MRARSLSDEEEELARDDEAAGSSASDYTFEGYTVEFSNKVMLTPIAPATAPVPARPRQIGRR